MLYQITWNMFADKKMECYKAFSKMTPADDEKDAGNGWVRDLKNKNLT